jgi:hypothetical protein|tara:strand:- start:246 stop:503 length:258 start_codon:yes stop_codon:yes gene_type:complete
MTPLSEIPIFFHIAALWWGFCIYMLVGEAFASRRFAMPVSIENPRRRRARHRAITVALSVIAAISLIVFVSAFLPDNMRGTHWPI